MINIYADPMTAIQIRDARALVARGDSLEDSAAFKIFMFCPIPVVDAIAGLAAFAIESSLKDDPESPWHYVAHSAERNWDGSDATKNYVDKVKRQGRDLTATEVDSLEHHLKLMSAADSASELAAYASGLASDMAKKTFGTLFGPSTGSPKT